MFSEDQGRMPAWPPSGVREHASKWNDPENTPCEAGANSDRKSDCLGITPGALHADYYSSKY